MRVVLLGPPGAGKGTQAKAIADALGIIHISSGDLLRDNQARGTDLGVTARSYMQQGLLVPDGLIIEMIEDRIQVEVASTGYVLDGFPRTVDQAEALAEALGKRGEHIDRVVSITVGEDELVTRLGGRWICRKCQTPYHEINSPPAKAGFCDHCDGDLYQREDDTSDAVSKRIKVFSDQTAPLIDYYTQEGNLVEINGEDTIEGVRSALLNALA